MTGTDLGEVRELIARHARVGTSEPVEGVFLSREARPGPPRLSTTGTGLAFIAQGAKQLTLGDQVIDYGPGEYLITPVDLPVVGRFTRATPGEPALGFGMTLTAPAITELLLAAGAPRPRSWGGSGAAVDRAPAELVDAIARLLRLLGRPRDLPVLGPMVRREILWLILSGPQRLRLPPRLPCRDRVQPSAVPEAAQASDRPPAPRVDKLRRQPGRIRRRL